MTENLDIACKAFQHAQTYHQVRENFSLQSAVKVLTHLGILDEEGQRNGKHSELIILELAAGTGKFTEVLVRALRNTNVKLISSEPLESMSQVFKRNFPDVTFICCRSEQIPLPDSSVHAIVAGNATHFISSPDSFAEMARVLVPGGGLGFVNLVMDAQVSSWCAEFYQLSAAFYQQTGLNMELDEYGIHVGWKTILNKSGKFSEITDDRSDSFVQPTTEKDTLQCLMSYGAFAVSEAKRDQVRERLRLLLARNYSLVGKTMTELPLRSVIFHAVKNSENGKYQDH